MKVLMTTDTLGGVWTYALQLAEGLQPHGVEIALATQGAALTADQRRGAEALENVRLYESRYRLEWMDDPWEDVAAAGEWLLELADVVSPDLVHLNDYSHAALPWGVPTLVVGHSCVCSWFQAVRGHQPGSEWDAYRRHVRQGLRAADRVVTPTQAMLDWLDDYYGPLGATEVIPNGIDTSGVVAGDGEEIIFTAGRLWDEAKNVQAVARVAERLKWPVHAAAIPHPEQGGVPPGGVHFLGRLSASQMAVAYRRASLYVLPARYEPFGLTPLEAALSGCALVLGDIPTLREVWGEAAWFVPPDEEGQLMRAINSLIDDAALRRAFAAAAHSRAMEFSATRMAEQYHTTYRSLSAGVTTDRTVVGRPA